MKRFYICYLIFVFIFTNISIAQNCYNIDYGEWQTTTSQLGISISYIDVYDLTENEEIKAKIHLNADENGVFMANFYDNKKDLNLDLLNSEQKIVFTFTSSSWTLINEVRNYKKIVISNKHPYFNIKIKKLLIQGWSSLSLFIDNDEYKFNGCYKL